MEKVKYTKRTVSGKEVKHPRVRDSEYAWIWTLGAVVLIIRRLVLRSLSGLQPHELDAKKKQEDS